MHDDYTWNLKKRRAKRKQKSSRQFEFNSKILFEYTCNEKKAVTRTFFHFNLIYFLFIPFRHTLRSPYSVVESFVSFRFSYISMDVSNMWCKHSKPAFFLSFSVACTRRCVCVLVPWFCEHSECDAKTSSAYEEEQARTRMSHPQYQQSKA